MKSAVGTIIRKELRLLVRDRVAAALLLGMPLVFILVLGLLLGEGFGQQPDDRLRISVVHLDRGPGPVLKAGSEPVRRWSDVVERDLAETGGIRVEVIDSLEEAQQLVRDHKRAAVLVFGPDFSNRLNYCSFLAEKDSINPFFRDGVYLDRVDAELLTDPLQPGSAAIIKQVAQVALLRVTLPWMIGRAFDRLSDPEFIQILGETVNLPLPAAFQLPFTKEKTIRLGELLKLASGGNARQAGMYEAKVGKGVQEALRQQFAKYNLKGKTWADLTRPLGQTYLVHQAATAVGLAAPGTSGIVPPQAVASAAVAALDTLPGAGGGGGGEISRYENREGSGLLARGAQRYQVLVPAYTVMFAFFLVLVVGGVFVSERRQGTLKRLRAAPLARWQILLGKLLPCLLVSLGQGLFLLLAGRLVFGMRWGPEDWPWWLQAAWLLPVVVATSVAAMGLALLVAAVARTELQVAIYGALPVLVLSLVGGCVLPRVMMPEQTQALTLFTPQGWALEAYGELLGGDASYRPNTALVLRACGMLAAFGAGFLAVAWGLLRLDE
jgi:ABC-type multidrug transport system permease subunit